MSPALLFRRIVAPQMIRYALPSFGNNWLVLTKSTALVSIIGLQDMVYLANAFGKSTREPFTFLLVAALLFLAITAVSNLVLGWLERKYSLGVRRA
jgi:ABC-type arginine transport system permease subunit